MVLHRCDIFASLNTIFLKIKKVAFSTNRNIPHSTALQARQTASLLASKTPTSLWFMQCDTVLDIAAERKKESEGERMESRRKGQLETLGQNFFRVHTLGLREASVVVTIEREREREREIEIERERERKREKEREREREKEKEKEKEKNL